MPLIWKRALYTVYDIRYHIPYKANQDNNYNEVPSGIRAKKQQ